MNSWQLTTLMLVVLAAVIGGGGWHSALQPGTKTAA
jgi:hypothetical protein